MSQWSKYESARGSSVARLVALVLVVMGAPCATAREGSENAAERQLLARSASPEQCSQEEFVAQYLAYRGEQSSTFAAMRRASQPWDYDQKMRFLMAGPLSLTRSELDCLADRGDQLALYLRGYSAIHFPTSALEIAHGLVDIARAAEPFDTTPIEACRDIDANGTYACGAGLPEAHLMLASMFGSCTSGTWRPEIAEAHLHLAMRAWVNNADLVLLRFGREAREARCVTRRPNRILEIVD